MRERAAGGAMLAADDAPDSAWLAPDSAWPHQLCAIDDVAVIRSAEPYKLALRGPMRDAALAFPWNASDRAALRAERGELAVASASALDAEAAARAGVRALLARLEAARAARPAFSAAPDRARGARIECTPSMRPRYVPPPPVPVYAEYERHAKAHAERTRRAHADEGEQRRAGRRHATGRSGGSDRRGRERGRRASAEAPALGGERVGERRSGAAASRVAFSGQGPAVGADRALVAASTAEPLPGGYVVGERVFYTGESKTVPSGDKRKRGKAGEVTGHPPSESFVFGRCLCVMFPGNKHNIGCLPTELSRKPPWPANVK